jgi:hypothetical protein
MTTDIEVKKVRPLLLWWLDKEKNKNLPAGVAFYDEKFGEYRLKLDIQPETQFYLRPISSLNKPFQLFYANISWYYIKKCRRLHF